MVTLAAAAQTLGWDYTFETRVLGLGAIDFGFLDGDLIVQGTGDPSLAEDDGSAQQVFRTWADRLKTQGVRALSGRIIGDDNAFDDEPLGAGWMWDDMDQAYSAGIGALQFNVDATRLTVTPAPVEGERRHADAAPRRQRADAAQSGRDGRRRRADARPTRAVSPDTTGPRRVGLVAARHVRRFNDAVAVDNPTLYFVVRAAQGARRATASTSRVRPSTSTHSARCRACRTPCRSSSTARRRSQPLADTLMKLSQNQYAETLREDAGRASRRRHVRRRTQGDRRSSSRAGASAPPTWSSPTAPGLSRYNLITPDALVTVLSHVQRDRGIEGAVRGVAAGRRRGGHAG